MVSKSPEDYNTRARHLCVIEPNQAEGRWKIGNRNYRPTWPIGSPGNETITREMVEQGIKIGNEYYGRTNVHPKIISVKKIGKKTDIVVK